MIEFNITSPGLERIAVKFERLASAVPRLIRKALTFAGVVLKRQIQQNLSGPAHTRYIYFDAGSRSQRMAAAGSGNDITKLRTSNKRLSGSRYSSTNNNNPFPGRLTGTLMSSVKSDVDSDGMSVAVGPHTRYAAIHEFGGWAGRKHASYIPPRPYVWPAWAERKAEIISGMETIMTEGIA